MPFSPARLGLLVLAVALVACEDNSPAESPALVGVIQADSDAGSVDPSLCAGLDECTCGQTPGCVPLTTDCWCPPESCGSTQTCTCSGGRYLGCNPRGAGCATSQCALFADPSLRDARGCVACADPSDCSTMIDELPALCPEMAGGDASWICAGANDPCAAFCVASLRTCAAAKCALCTDCSCGDDLFDSCLRECQNSTSQTRH